LLWLLFPPNEEVAGGVSGEHNLRGICMGSPIARLTLYVNDQKLVDAYDDDAIEAGGAGFAASSPPPGGSVLFDDFLLQNAE
jgi:hypothetical protein